MAVPRKPIRRGDPLVVVIAPDSFKGTLTSVEVAAALAEGWRRVRPGDELRLRPLADGGEGTLAAIAAADGWQWHEADAPDPIGRPMRARWLRSSSADRAVVEMAEASGLSRLTPAERDPRGATTDGTGEVLRAVIDAGLRQVTLGIGGSATTDGGTGILRALGAGITFAPGSLAAVDLAGLAPRLSTLDLVVASDVTNPLLGPNGAAATYGPQKGATPDDVAHLDDALRAWANALEAATGRRERETPGAGAAGGVGFALLCLRDRLRSLEFRPGVDVVMELTRFEAALEGADLVITGEGRIDAQTAFGKTAAGVARRAQRRGISCVAVGGRVERDGVAALRALGAEAVPVWDTPVSLHVALRAGAGPVIACGERLARAHIRLTVELTKSSD